MEKMVQEKIEIRSLQQIVYEKIKEEILNGTYKPGDIINSADLAKRFGISRTPARDAISKLESIALVEMVPRCGYRVVGFSISEVLETYHLRAAMESMAAGFAASNFTEDERRNLSEICRESEKVLEMGTHEEFLKLNKEMHEVIYRAIKTDSIRDLLRRYRDITRRYAALGVELSGRNDELLKEHRSLVDAIVQGDVEQAQYFAQIHLLNTAKSIAENWKESNGFR